MLYIIITAHPDDESMFFLPLIEGLRMNGHDTTSPTKNAIPVEKPNNKYKNKIWLICLTSGNYDGLGPIRIHEMQQAGALLGLDRLLVVDQPDTVQDHPRQAWDIPKVAKLLQDQINEMLQLEMTQEAKREQEQCASNDTTQDGMRASDHQNHQQEGATGSTTDSIHLITFDYGGVSGHVNHRDTFLAVRQLYYDCLSTKSIDRDDKSKQSDASSGRGILLSSDVSMWTLDSVTNPLVKYVPLYSWILLLLCWLKLYPVVTRTMTTSTTARTTATKSNQTTIVYRLLRPALNWNAMQTHHSQFVWYRRLFVVFSSYTYVNVLRLEESCAVSKED